MCFFNTKQIFLIIFLLFLFFCHHLQLVAFIKRAIIQNCINRHLDTHLYNYYSFLFFYLPTVPLIPQIIWQISFWCLILHRLSFQDICKHNRKRLPHGVKAVKKNGRKNISHCLKYSQTLRPTQHHVGLYSDPRTNLFHRLCCRKQSDTYSQCPLATVVDSGIDCPHQKRQGTSLFHSSISRCGLSRFILQPY